MIAAQKEDIPAECEIATDGISQHTGGGNCVSLGICVGGENFLRFSTCKNARNIV